MHKKGANINSIYDVKPIFYYLMIFIVKSGNFHQLRISCRHSLLEFTSLASFIRGPGSDPKNIVRF